MNKKEQERKHLNKEILRKTSGNKTRKEILVCFVKNCIVLFTAFALSDSLVERFWIDSRFFEMIIRVVLAAILYVVGMLAVRSHN